MRRLQAFGFLLVFLGVAALPLCATETGTFERTLQVSGQVELDVTSGAGNIKVHKGESGSVHVYATIRAQNSWFGSNASEKVKKLQANPPIQQQGNSIRIGKIEDRDLQQNVSIDYDITTPAETKVTSQTGSGDQNIDDMQLAVSARAGSGNVNVNNIGSDVRVRSGSGDLKVASVKGSVDAEAGSGNIRGRGIAGAISASSGSGEIEMDQAASGSVRASTGSGNVKLRGVNGTLKVDTGSGDITVDGNPTGDWRVAAGSGKIDLKVPSGASFNIDAHTSSGSLRVNRQVTAEGGASHNRIQGKVGSGGVLVSLHTGSGDIHVD
jgi:DUF4097 and DUF4098 domain-containing protein YvlB